MRCDPNVNAGGNGPGWTGKRPPRAGLRIGRAALVSVLAVAGLSFAGSPAIAQPPSAEPWVGLDGGRMGDVQWSVKIARPAGPAAAQRPCLMVGTKRQRSPFDYERSRYQGCVARSSHLAPTGSPLIVTGAQATAGLEVRLTAVGMVSSPAARRILVTYDDGRRMAIPLRESSPSQERDAGLVHFRYAAFAIPGAWSVERLVTQTASGRTLWDSAAAG